MKLWQKEIDVNQNVDRFTVGKDRELDVLLARADVLGSLAHTRMLESIGLMSSEDLASVQKELKEIFASVERGEFNIEDGVEDVHSQVEFLLTERIGDAGKKIHSGRSRNDQVLVDLRIFLRRELFETVMHIKELFDTLFDSGCMGNGKVVNRHMGRLPLLGREHTIVEEIDDQIAHLVILSEDILLIDGRLATTLHGAIEKRLSGAVLTLEVDV